MERTLRRVQKLLDTSERVLILLHQYPDGDTIASSLALAVYLKRTQKQVDLAVKGEVPEIFRFLPHIGWIKSDFLLGDYDLIVAVDCGDANRTGYPHRLGQVGRSRPLINIDHHYHNNLHKIAKINLVDESVSAAAEIIWRLLVFMEAKIDSLLATYILTGIYYDTGGFQHSNVTPKTLQIAAECLRLGGRIGLVSSRISATKSPAALKLWGQALKKMRVKPDGVVLTYLTQTDLERCHACADDAAGLVNLICAVPNSRLAILFLQMPDGKIKVSLRTESDGVDVSKLARLFGGGGHKKAAGFSLESESLRQFKL